MLIKNKISDPLNELTLPNFSRLGINHHSPTQASMNDGIYLFRYIVCTQEERRLFEGNANMMAGVVTGDALQDHYSDKIWRFNPLTKKLQPQDNKKITKEAAIQKAMDKFSSYIPVSDLDREKFDHYKESIPQTIRQGYLAFESIGINKSKKISAEDSISHIDNRLQLSIVGRSDITFQDLNDKEQSLSDGTTPVDPFLSVLCEIKTTWQKPMKMRKDGSRSFARARLPHLPNKIHLQQLSFYATAKSPVEPMLIYLTADGFQIFNKNNCTDLEPQNLKNYYEQLVKICMRRERMLSRYAHLNDTDAIIKELIADTNPEFEHPFYWNIGNKFLNKAKQVWNNIK